VSDVAAERTGSVIGEEDLPMQALTGSTGWVRVPIDRSRGCRNLLQRVFRYERGSTPVLVNEDSEDVLYVVSGRGEANVGGEHIELEPGVAVRIPPGAHHSFDNPGPHDLSMVSVMAPQPGQPPPPLADSDVDDPPRLTTTEEEEEALPAGEDRYFKVLMDPRYGARYVTQFVGFIDRSAAPPHSHTYEEAVYVLEGEGRVHIAERVVPIRRGTSIFLPPGIPHRLENRGPGTLKLLGVFSPAGSPADKDEALPV
jgi:mannose-6-phosphate isomerase-like protein (cupin superfamily)